MLGTAGGGVPVLEQLTPPVGGGITSQRVEGVSGCDGEGEMVQAGLQPVMALAGQGQPSPEEPLGCGIRTPSPGAGSSS